MAEIWAVCEAFADKAWAFEEDASVRLRMKNEVLVFCSG